MTTGNFTSGAFGTTNVATGYHKQWNGANGKYQTVGGRVRVKWNDYQLINLRRRYPGRPGSTGFYYSMENQPSNYATPFSAADIVKVQSKLASAIRDHDFNLAVNIAQGKQTMALVHDNIRDLTKAVIRLKHFDLRGACNALGCVPRKQKKSAGTDFASRWLELQYGWLPTLGDTYEAMRAYADISGGTRLVKGSVSLNKKGVYEGSTSPSNYTAAGTYKYRYRIQYEIYEQLSAPRSLGLYDPLSLAWELIPYSFVVDWFLPIGSYLENLNTLPFVNGRFITTTTKLLLAHGVGGSSAPYKGFDQRFMKLVSDRAVTSSIPIQKPGFISLPKSMSPGHLYNALALFSQAMRS